MARILVIDDEIVVCGSVGKILRRDNHEITCVLTAEEGMEFLENQSFDLIITDLMLPKMSGMELLEKVKEKWPGIRVVMITGYATVKNALEAMKHGAFDFLPKPFTPDELRTAAERALQRNKLGSAESAVSKIQEDIADSENMYCIPEYSWVRLKDDMAVVGIDRVFLKTIGDIEHIEFPFKGDELLQGSICARLAGKNDRIYTIWTPISGKVIEINYDLNKDISILKKDPYGKGWLMTLQASSVKEDLRNLLKV